MNQTPSPMVLTKVTESKAQSALTDISNNSLPEELKTILLWTPFFGVKNYLLPLERYGCSVSNCIITSDRSMLSAADAVIFHVRDTNIYDLPKKRYHRNQKYILLHHEAPPATPRDVMRELSGLINWTVTYRLDSDVVLTPRYKRKDVANKHIQRDYTANKTRMIAWFVSNCNTDSRRESFVRSLQNTIPVDVFGSCGPFVCNPKMSNKCYKTIAREYRFYLSLENAICKDYATEKVFNILDFDIIPVVLGGGDYETLLPKKSFINALNFETSSQLGQFLIRLAKDAKEYNSYFDWRSHYELDHYDHYACQICRKLHDDSQPVKVWNNLEDWWFKESGCKRWPVAKTNDEFNYQEMSIKRK